MRLRAYPEIGRRITISQGKGASKASAPTLARLTRTNGFGDGIIDGFALNDPLAC